LLAAYGSSRQEDPKKCDAIDFVSNLLAQAEQRAGEEARALDAKQRRYLYEEGWRRL